MKPILLLMISFVICGNVFSQSIEDGKKFLYDERYQSAKDVFQKLSDASPADEIPAYYLGQALIGLDDEPGAKALYLQKLSATPNSPLLLAGMGQIALLEGNPTDARSRFDAAVSLSGGKRIDVLNAVGAPNSDPDIKNGDPNYAIQKLNQATTLKGFKDPEVNANLGDAYRKIGDGGSAITAYDQALAINPNYARAIYRKGRLYQSQGTLQEKLYLQFYNDAIAKDPTYAPVYQTLYNYYYLTDVPKSATYLDKYLSYSDNDPHACYLRASIKYAQALFADAITQANSCITAGNIYPKIYGIKAYAYNKLGDSVNAKASFEDYFKHEAPDKIGGGDYSTYGLILLKFPGNEDLAASYIQKAVDADSVEANKVSYVKAIANAYRDSKNFAQSAYWFNKVLAVKSNYSNLDIYNAGYDYFRAAKFDSSAMLFNTYTQKYPDDMFGYYMFAKATSGVDTLRTGAAPAAYMKAAEIGEKATDPSKVKDYLVGSYNYLSQYEIEIKKDKAAAIAYNNKAIALDPSDATAAALKDFLAKWDPNARQTTRPAARPAGHKK